jgi:hypothetical protein
MRYEGTVEGTIGTQITIAGSDFGTKKGKATVGGKSCKISQWANESITCEIKTALPPGTYDVVVQPKEPKDAQPITYAGAFTMMAPEIILVDPGSAPTKKINVSGIYFGTKKGKVYLVNPVSGRRKYCSISKVDMDDDGDYEDEIKVYKKACKVKEWAMNPATGVSTLTFTTYRKLRAGTTWSLEVVNKVGRAAALFTVN